MEYLSEKEFKLKMLLLGFTVSGSSYDYNSKKSNAEVYTLNAHNKYEILAFRLITGSTIFKYFINNRRWIRLQGTTNTIVVSGNYTKILNTILTMLGEEGDGSVQRKI